MARTKYRKVYCNKIIAYMSLGKSLNQFAHSISVVTGTLHNWSELYPDFDEAMERGKQASLAYWEEKLEDYITLGKDVNAPLVKLLFAHRFKWYDSRPKDLEIPVIEQPNITITVDPGKHHEPFVMKEDQKPNHLVH